MKTADCWSASQFVTWRSLRYLSFWWKFRTVMIWRWVSSGEGRSWKVVSPLVYSGGGCDVTTSLRTCCAESYFLFFFLILPWALLVFIIWDLVGVTSYWPVCAVISCQKGLNVLSRRAEQWSCCPCCVFILSPGIPPRGAASKGGGTVVK